MARCEDYDRTYTNLKHDVKRIFDGKQNLGQQILDADFNKIEHQVEVSHEHVLNEAEQIDLHNKKGCNVHGMSADSVRNDASKCIKKFQRFERDRNHNTAMETMRQVKKLKKKKQFLTQFILISLFRIRNSTNFIRKWIIIRQSAWRRIATTTMPIALKCYVALNV